MLVRPGGADLVGSPPHSHLFFPSPSVMSGLLNMNISKAEDLAFDLAQRWIKTNWVVYKKYEAMFEKVSRVGGVMIFLPCVFGLSLDSRSCSG